MAGATAGALIGGPPGAVVGAVIGLGLSYYLYKEFGPVSNASKDSANDIINVAPGRCDPEKCPFTGLAKIMPFADLKGHVVRCQYRCPKGLGYADIFVGKTMPMSPTAVCPIALFDYQVKPQSYLDGFY